MKRALALVVLLAASLTAARADGPALPPTCEVAVVFPDATGASCSFVAAGPALVADATMMHWSVYVVRNGREVVLASDRGSSSLGGYGFVQVASRAGETVHLSLTPNCTLPVSGCAPAGWLAGIS